MEQALCIWDPRVNWLLIIVAAIAVAVFLYGLKMGWSTLQLRLFGRRTRGKVIAVIRKVDPDAGPIFQPWIRFKSETGQVVTFADDWQGADVDAVGTEIPLVYDTVRPAIVQVASNVKHFVNPMFCVIMSVAGIWALTQLDCSPSWSSGRNSAKCNSGWLGATGCGPPP